MYIVYDQVPELIQLLLKQPQQFLKWSLLTKTQFKYIILIILIKYSQQMTQYKWQQMFACHGIFLDLLKYFNNLFI